MSCCVFIGPTSPVAAAEVPFDDVRLPPARQGDVYRAVKLHRPDAIGIVDGYFHQVPAVCHKEILWAMAQGVRVFGAASMGALRAAELAAFGMIGVGRVFEAYRDGILAPYGEPFEDDDEVAVIHGPAEVDYLAVSEAMVNIRVTLAAAAEAGIVDAATRDGLAKIAKRLFYPERTYETIFAAAVAAGIRGEALAKLREWLPIGRVDQKRADAIALFAALRDHGRGGIRVGYQLAHTTMWEGVMARALPE